VERAGDVLAAARDRAVEVAVEVDHHAARWKAAVIAAVEGMQDLLLAVRRDPEHGALVERAAAERGAVEIAVGIQSEAAVGIGAVATGREGVQQFEASAERYQFEHRAEAGVAAVLGRAIEVIRAILDQAADGIGAVAAASEGIVDRLAA